MANSADPDQLASSEANSSGSTQFAKAGYIGSAGQGLSNGSCLFVLRFYGPVNPMGSVYLTTHLLGRLSPLSG